MKKMKKFYPNKFTACLTAAVLTVLSVTASCELLGLRSDDGKGELRISFARGQEALTRAGVAIPDTSDFLLNIKDSKGDVVYDGKYGDSPESIFLDSGSYTVTVVSEEFSKPAFSAPQFGDEQCVVIPSGKSVNLKLVCTQINSGIKLKIDSGFLDAYPNGILMLKSSYGRLIYGYSEKRTAYFKPGDISLVLNEGKSDKVLMTRYLKAREILELKVMVANAGTASQGGVMSIQVDTMRNWRSDTYIIGENQDGGSGKYDALTVSEALSSVGEEEVWVCGYIVGGDLSSSSASFEKPFSARTNFLLGPKSTTKVKEACLSVQLPSGELRDALNLADNPELLGRKICLKGNIVEAYYGIPGMKGITEYELL